MANVDIIKNSFTCRLGCVAGHLAGKGRIRLTRWLADSVTGLTDWPDWLGQFVNFRFETRLQLNFIACYALLPFALRPMSTDYGQRTDISQRFPLPMSWILISSVAVWRCRRHFHPKTGPIRGQGIIYAAQGSLYKLAIVATAIDSITFHRLPVLTRRTGRNTKLNNGASYAKF